jgi:hypothetical protein
MNKIRLQYQQDTGIQIEKHIPTSNEKGELIDYIQWLEEGLEEKSTLLTRICKVIINPLSTFRF